MKLKYSTCSVLFLLTVYLLISMYVFPPDTFFTCDNGMKYLQVFYLVKNGFQSDQIPYAGRFIDPGEKYFPILPPFAYRIGGPTYAEYPLLFAVLSALPYIALGFRGLFLIPAFSTVISAVVLLRLLTLLGIADERRRALLVLFYGLGTPVFFYSLVFWEHTFSVMLFLTAVYFICRGLGDDRGRWFVAAGLVIGFSAWARFENAAYFVACVIALLLAVRARLRSLVYLSLPVIAAVLLLFLCNARYYGFPLGPHIIQVLRTKLGVFGHLRLAARLLFAPLSGLLVMCPFMLILAPGVRLLGRAGAGEKAPVRETARFIYLATVISIAIVILTTYNDGGRQWGPRYLLPVLPLGVVLLALVSRGAGRALRWLIIIIVVSSACISLLGVGRLYRRKVSELYPAVSWIESCEYDYIVFPSTYAVLEMAASFPEKTYFMANGFGDFLEIAYKLGKAGKDEIASCRWEEGSFAELYERRRHEIGNERERFYLERVERYRASRDYTFYMWKMVLETKQGS